MRRDAHHEKMALDRVISAWDAENAYWYDTAARLQYLAQRFEDAERRRKEHAEGDTDERA